MLPCTIVHHATCTTVHSGPESNLIHSFIHSPSIHPLDILSLAPKALNDPAPASFLCFLSYLLPWVPYASATLNRDSVHTYVLHAQIHPSTCLRVLSQWNGHKFGILFLCHLLAG